MSLFRTLGRAALVNQMLRNRRGRHHGRSRGYGRRPRGRTGFFGPVPYYSRQTRSGGRVSVGGCCLPIPLALAVGGATAARALLRR